MPPPKSLTLLSASGEAESRPRGGSGSRGVLGRGAATLGDEVCDGLNLVGAVGDRASCSGARVGRRRRGAFGARSVGGEHGGVSLSAVIINQCKKL